MRIKVNGVMRDLEPEPNPSNLANVLKLLGHDPRLIVVEFNGTILPPQKWSAQQVHDQDSLEIVTIVGGGS